MLETLTESGEFPAMQHVPQKRPPPASDPLLPQTVARPAPGGSYRRRRRLDIRALGHGGEYPDTMPQAIRATDAQGRSCVYVPIKEDGRVVDSCGFKLVKSEAS